jgi:hypothetical protein
MARMPSQDLRTAARSYQHKRNSKVPGRGRKWLAAWFCDK